MEGPGPYLSDVCARPACGHAMNFHQSTEHGPGSTGCVRAVEMGRELIGATTRPPLGRCGCPAFLQSEADARRDRRWRQLMATNVLGGFEVAIGEAFGKDVVEKTAPLLRRVRAILSRATTPATESKP